MFDFFYTAFFFLMLFQGLINLYLTLYVWEDPDRLEEHESPKTFKHPSKSFTLLIPARHEERVIEHTIKSILNINYPKNLMEIFIICDSSDSKTIKKASASIKKYGLSNAKVLVYADTPINKPHGLNHGLRHATNDIVVIFDAEDDMDKDILNVANTLYLSKKNPDVIQAGVQLMDYSSHWYSPHNVLEYYFWFKSRMHFHTKVGMVPLGGNTVFFKTKLLKNLGGWNDSCLTEDAEIGIRLSANGAKIISIYDPKHITKEETPSTVGQFIKQRARWNQGFIQILLLKGWGSFDNKFKKVLCLYTLSFPIFQAISLFSSPFLFIEGIFGNLPIYLTLFGFVPLMLILMQYIINILALREFIHEQHLPNNRGIYAYMLLTLIPYQVLLSIGVIRALEREIRGISNWEKTIHLGIHRDPRLELGTI